MYDIEWYRMAPPKMKFNASIQIADSSRTVLLSVEFIYYQFNPINMTTLPKIVIKMRLLSLVLILAPIINK